ncbi:hypothetical protein BX666DRAFT_1667998 [Dichotomocladium elegans]|nr:hypothetical protein BX666DRAFT_1667998 [Dichotomocladium elegans]
MHRFFFFFFLFLLFSDSYNSDRCLSSSPPATKKGRNTDHAPYPIGSYRIGGRRTKSSSCVGMISKKEGSEKNCLIFPKSYFSDSVATRKYC